MMFSRTTLVVASAISGAKASAMPSSGEVSKERRCLEQAIRVMPKNKRDKMENLIRNYAVCEEEEKTGNIKCSLDAKMVEPSTEPAFNPEDDYSIAGPCESGSYNSETESWTRRLAEDNYCPANIDSKKMIVAYCEKTERCTNLTYAQNLPSLTCEKLKCGEGSLKKLTMKTVGSSIESYFTQAGTDETTYVQFWSLKSKPNKLLHTHTISESRSSWDVYAREFELLDDAGNSHDPSEVDYITIHMLDNKLHNGWHVEYVEYDGVRWLLPSQTFSTTASFWVDGKTNNGSYGKDESCAHGRRVTCKLYPDRSPSKGGVCFEHLAEYWVDKDMVLATYSGGGWIYPCPQYCLTWNLDKSADSEEFCNFWQHKDGECKLLKTRGAIKSYNVDRMLSGMNCDKKELVCKQSRFEDATEVKLVSLLKN